MIWGSDRKAWIVAMLIVTQKVYGYSPFYWKQNPTFIHEKHLFLLHTRGSPLPSFLRGSLWFLSNVWGTDLISFFFTCSEHLCMLVFHFMQRDLIWRPRKFTNSLHWRQKLPYIVAQNNIFKAHRIEELSSSLEFTCLHVLQVLMEGILLKMARQQRDDKRRSNCASAHSHSRMNVAQSFQIGASSFSVDAVARPIKTRLEALLWCQPRFRNTRGLFVEMFHWARSIPLADHKFCTMDLTKNEAKAKSEMNAKVIRLLQQKATKTRGNNNTKLFGTTDGGYSWRKMERTSGNRPSAILIKKLSRYLPRRGSETFSCTH